MPLTYTQFFVLSRPGEAEYPQVINVSAWSEDTEWGGELRPAFDGTMLSTLRTPKRRIKATFEFANGTDLENFLALIATTVDPVSLQVTGLRKMALRGNINAALRRVSLLVCYIQPGTKTPTEEIVNNAVVLHWAVEMTILEA